jgi:Protein-L-isoaspartate(D-aspartate) O-methyltransferase (PCMT)
MGQTQRHLFIPERSCSIAYADMPVPIGLGQTISQPFIVALLTQLAGSRPITLCSKSVLVRAIRAPSLRIWRERSAPSRLFRNWPRQ